MSSRRILVIGAAGETGRYTKRLLLKRGVPFGRWSIKRICVPTNSTR